MAGLVRVLCGLIGSIHCWRHISHFCTLYNMKSLFKAESRGSVVFAYIRVCYIHSFPRIRSILSWANINPFLRLYLWRCTLLSLFTQTYVTSFICYIHSMHSFHEILTLSIQFHSNITYLYLGACMGLCPIPRVQTMSHTLRLCEPFLFFLLQKWLSMDWKWTCN